MNRTPSARYDALTMYPIENTVNKHRDAEDRISSNRSGRRAAMARDGRLEKAQAETVSLSGAQADALMAPIVECAASKAERAYEQRIAAAAPDMLAALRRCMGAKSLVDVDAIAWDAIEKATRSTK